MAFYDSHTIEQLKAASDVVEVIESYIPLKRRGNRFIAVCPFHQDSNPSLYVTPSMGIYKCFACGAGGDVFKFVQEFEKVEFNEAIQILAQKASFTLPEIQPAKQPAPQEIKFKDVALKMHKEAQQFFRESFKKSDLSNYLRNRGITAETEELFGFGFAPNQWDGLLQHFLPRGFSKPDALKAGLLSENNQGRSYDRFRNRLMVPIKDPSGKVIAFGGRALDPNDKAKYLNSPETELYHKSKVLYGFDLAKNEISKAGEVYIVEGYFDVIQLHQHGLTNTIAVSGTALTPEHCKLLSRYCKKVFLVFDGDEAGIKAAHRSLPHLLPTGLEPRVVCLPLNEDPDTIVKEQGKEGFLKYVDKSKSWVEFLVGEDVKLSPEQKAQTLDQIKELLALIRNPVIRSEYEKEVSQRLQLNTAYVKPTLAAQSKPIPQIHRGKHTFPQTELKFAFAVLNNNKTVALAASHLDLTLFKTPLLQDLLIKAFEFIEESPEFNLKIFFHRLSPSLQQLLETWEPHEEATPEQQLREYMQILVRFELERFEKFWKKLKLEALHNPAKQKTWEEVFQKVLQIRKIKSHLFDTNGQEVDSFKQFLVLLPEIHDWVHSEE